MLPISLSIEGLYSYQEKQTIDFTQLNEAGLFGIFGSVGSGKSSILEAITFALYGVTERLNTQDKRTYNMMNLKSNQTIIDFEFLNYESKKYRFVAQWKRRKNFEDTTPLERTAYEWKNDAWLPLDSADGELITNLSYPNFRRTIIIPQGKFKEFLELKGKDRSEMMKEIFFLNKYDLGPKVSFLSVNNNRKLENLKGALSGFESISAEALELKRKEVKEAKDNLEITKSTYPELLAKVQSIQEIKDKQAELKLKQDQYLELSSKKEKVKKQELELQKYESTLIAFKEPLNIIQNLNAERDILIRKIEGFQVVKERQSQEIDVLEKEITIVQKDYLGLNNLRIESEDYKYIIQLKENADKEVVLENRLKKGLPYVDKAKLNEQEVNSQLLETEIKLQALKADKVDASQLLQMEKWYQKKEGFKQQRIQLHSQLNQIEDDIQKELELFMQEGYLESNWDQMLSNELNLIESKIYNHREQETHLKVQARLSGFASELQVGHPCPLCGALDHPTPMLAEHIQDELQKAKEVGQELDKQKIIFQQVKDKLTKNSISLESKKQQKIQLGREIELLDLSIEEHNNKFQWEGFSADNTDSFEAQKDRLVQNEQAIQSFEEKEKQLKAELQRSKDNIVKFEKELDTIRAEIAVIQGVSRHNLNNLHSLNFENFKEIDLEEIKNSKINLESKISQIENNYVTLTQKINTHKTKLAEVVGQYNAAKDNLSYYNSNIKQKQEIIAKLLKEHKFNDIIEVQQIILRPLPVEQLRYDIQQYFIRLEVLESQISSLKEFMNNKTYSDEDFQQSMDLFALKKEELELQLALTGGLEKELSHITLEFGKKEKLLEEFEQVSNRAANLKTLENLFKGNGFVNYVSSIHLKQMCEMANQRFHRLTRNQLSLSINDQNEFEVIDYLNNGYRRSVKTLSGGQGFQASLCLALALAENIQSLNKSDRNFFFIDEGFGTQDNDSINTVFDTLQYLHQENKVVGIISHVEELKEKIPRSITIEKDAEYGSKVKES